MKRILSVALLVLLTVSMFAAKTANAEAKASPAAVSTIKVKGNVADKLSKELLAGATITVNGQKVYSDLDGNFTLPCTDNNKLKITVSLISYEEQVYEVNAANASALKIELKQR